MDHLLYLKKRAEIKYLTNRLESILNPAWGRASKWKSWRRYKCSPEQSETPSYTSNQVPREVVAEDGEKSVFESLMTENFSELIKTQVHMCNKPNKFQVA